MNTFIAKKIGSIAVVIVVSFFSGVLFHKFDIHLALKSIIRGNHLIIPEARRETVMIEGEEVTLGGTPIRGEAYEETQLDALKSRDQPLNQLTPRHDYREYLDTALGFSSPRPKVDGASRGIRTERNHPFGTGSLKEIFLDFETPPLSVRGLIARHSAPANGIVVILHGLGSTADKVMGTDTPDYHRALGRRLFDSGRDVLAIDATSKAYVGSTLTMRLEFYGTTTHGLISRGTCELINRLELRAKYRKVVLYGLSNGGELAHHIATLCSGFDLVISDDGTPNWRTAMWSVPGKLIGDAKYPMFTRRLRPLFAEISTTDLLYHAASPLAIILPKKEIKTYAAVLGPYMRASPTPRAGARVNFLVKQTEHHAPEIANIILPLLEGRYEKLEGLAFDLEK